MNPHIFITSSVLHTVNLGRWIGSWLRSGDVLLLEGDLGAGKTAFVQGVAHAFSVDATTVTSPTFSYMHIYPGTTPLYHFDLYRLHDMHAFIQAGFHEYLHGQGICLIE